MDEDIKVYVSNVTSNDSMRKRQLHVTDILEAHHIPFQRIDITDPCNEEEKKYMRANSEARPGFKFPLPPQVFNKDEYCGDYEVFADKLEYNELWEFLKLAKPKSVSDAEVIITGGPQGEQAAEEKTLTND